MFAMLTDYIVREAEKLPPIQAPVAAPTQGTIMDFSKG